MTKIKHKNRNCPAQPSRANETCSCGKDCSCCQCCKAKAFVAGASALALILSVWTFVSGPRDRAIENWVRANPEIIADALQNGDAPRGRGDLQAAPKDLVKEIIDDKTNYSLGNPNGSFVIIEFFDHNCGWCKRTNAAMKEALAKPEAQNIRWIPIDTPIFGKPSEMIARYVLAAGEQGKYAQMHDAVANAKDLLEARKKIAESVDSYISKNKLNPKENQDDRAKVEEHQDKLVDEMYTAALVKIGTDLGLDGKALKEAAESDKLKTKLASNRKYTSKLKVGGVPMLIVDGNIHPGALFGEDLDAVVAESNAGCWDRFKKWLKSLF